MKAPGRQAPPACKTRSSNPMRPKIVMRLALLLLPALRLLRRLLRRRLRLTLLCHCCPPSLRDGMFICVPSRIDVHCTLITTAQWTKQRIHLTKRLRESRATHAFAASTHRACASTIASTRSRLQFRARKFAHRTNIDSKRTSCASYFSCDARFAMRMKASAAMTDTARHVPGRAFTMPKIFFGMTPEIAWTED